MQFVYKGTAESAASKSRLRAALILVIGVLMAAVGGVLILKKQVFPGILVIFVAILVCFFAILRFAQIKNLLGIVRKSKLEITDEKLTGVGFLLKGGLCLPATAELSFEDIKSVKPHTPNERSFDYATVEVRSKDENYFFSVEEPDKAIVEIRLRMGKR